MKKIIVANWKANLSPVLASKWLASFTEKYRPAVGIRVVLAASYLHLPMFFNEYNLSGQVSWAAQDVSPFPPGGYTGAVPAAWLKGMAEFVLVGHRERRRYFHETVQETANKVFEVADAGLTPILCMDRKISGKQIVALDPADMENMIIAYTPDDAEALEVSRELDSVAENAAYLKEISGGCPVIYGGGVNKDNVADLLTMTQLSGVMVASGCIDPQDFIDILHNAADGL